MVVLTILEPGSVVYSTHRHRAGPCAPIYRLERTLQVPHLEPRENNPMIRSRRRANRILGIGRPKEGLDHE